MSLATSREIVLVHSSDLHLGTDYSFGPARSHRLSVLRDVLETASAVRADLVVLAGDTFDHNRQPSQLLERAVGIMREFAAPIVILPGNHDPLTPDSVYRRAEMAGAANVCVLGLTVEEGVVFSGLGLEVWGRAHLDYTDMAPLREPRSRSTRWQLAAAHGHYVEAPAEPGQLLGSWLICRDEIIATGSDYVALGHWNRPARVGGHTIHAYYSGSPDHAGTVNVVRFGRNGGVEVSQAALSNSAPPMEADRSSTVSFHSSAKI
ncbi:MAG: metallophosphoesterase [Deltaproteobacteria bacterium]|nr:metallophosphoesterase [Deltaproteobacteria bacterium]